MKNVEIFKGEWTIDNITNNPDKIFVFSDNFLRKGKVSIIRDLPNTVGLRIKKGPSNKLYDFYTDVDLLQNSKYILDDILDIKNYLMLGKTIVLSDSGYGRLLLEDKCPMTYSYICKCLKDHLQYDNKTGRSWIRIPSHDEIMNAKEFSIDDLTYQENSKIFDSIRERKKIAISHEEIFNNGDIIKLTSKHINEYIICKVITDSYPITSISKEYWSSFEGPYIYSDDVKNQFQFQYICTVIDGTMIFTEDLFTNH